MQRLHAIIDGRVQNVGFREYTRAHATQFGLTGWVRNRPDGTVEVLAEGEDVAISRLWLALEKGPRMAAVDSVHVEFTIPSGEFADFRVRHD